MGYHLGETRSGTTIVALVTNVATIQNFCHWPPDAAPKTDLSLLLPSAKQEGHFIFELLTTPLLLPLVKDCVDPFVGLSLEIV